MSKFETMPIAYRPFLGNSLRGICDVCGKRRGGSKKINHDKCSEIRKRR